jgi:hypothetical protein
VAVAVVELADWVGTSYGVATSCPVVVQMEVLQHAIGVSKSLYYGAHFTLTERESVCVCIRVNPGMIGKPNGTPFPIIAPYSTARHWLQPRHQIDDILS